MRLIHGNRIPRKAKKALLGERKTHGQIRRMLEKVHIVKEIVTIYDGFGLNDAFCMECGCPVIVWSGNMETHPFLWEVGTCARCGRQVAEADNSPYHHELYDYVVRRDEAC